MKRLVPHWRKMTWTLWIWTGVMFTWIIGASVSGAHQAARDCAHPGVLSRQTCLDASHAGTGIGAALVFGLWFFGFIVLGFVWFMTRPREVVIVQAPSAR